MLFTNVNIVSTDILKSKFNKYKYILFTYPKIHIKN